MGQDLTLCYSSLVGSRDRSSPIGHHRTIHVITPRQERRVRIGLTRTLEIGSEIWVYDRCSLATGFEVAIRNVSSLQVTVLTLTKRRQSGRAERCQGRGRSKGTSRWREAWLKKTLIGSCDLR